MESLDLQSPTFAAVVLGFALIELFWRKKSGRSYDLGAGAASIGVAVGQFATKALNALVVGLLSVTVYTLTPLRIDMAHWWAWPAAFLSVEFLYYWFHRLSHETRWLWATHAVHHTPNEMTFLAAIRLGWTGLLAGAPLFYMPAIALGFHPAVVFGLLVINLRFQFFLHTDMIPKLGPLELIFNTPSNHRVHHAANPCYIDKNYGGVIMIFDHLFGTYMPERDEETCRYGLVEPLTSNNPFVIALHQWPKLIRELWAIPSLTNKLAYAFSYPGHTNSQSAHDKINPNVAARCKPAPAD